jgi:hypothetical protein
MNSDPIVTTGADTTVALCSSSQVCFDYTVTDPDNNVSLEALLPNAVSAVIDTSLNQVCFSPTASGSYELIVEVTDACGAVDSDTIVITVQFNTPPVADAGADQSVFQCQPTELCWRASCSDPGNNLYSCYLKGTFGTYNGSQICFTPDTAGVYTFVLRAVDDCGESDEDTVAITIQLNSPPVCQVPANTSYFQCSPQQVTLPVSGNDIDNNFDHCELIGGPGSLVGGNWVYTPTTDETVTVKVMCLDDCGASCIDSFTVQFSLNRPPVVNSGADTTYFLCNSETICWDVDASDPDGNLAQVELVSTFGSYNDLTGQICATIPYTDGLDKTYTFIMKATDSCGAEAYDTTVVSIDFNAPPVVSGPPDFVAFIGQPGELCFNVAVNDEDDNLAGPATVSPVGTYNTGQVCFDADTTGTYCIVISAVDDCGLSAEDTVCIEVQVDECIHVQIEKVHDVIQGQYTTVNVFLNGGSKDLGGFDFLITYDQAAIIPTNIVPGAIFESCGWEYFNYRFGYSGNCGGCPSGAIRLVGLAETNNGAYHPGCFLNGLVGPLASINFLVSNDRTLNCHYVPIEFYWYDCGDNALSSRLGDTLWVVRDVFDFEYNNITNHAFGFPSKYGAPDTCLAGEGPGKPVPIRCIDFVNGGIDIICSDSIDARGDVNLNGIAYEVGDAVMFTNYFLSGLTAFGPGMTLEEKTRQQGSVAATDVNADGITLTVADLVYLIRVIVGDALPTPKLRPGDPALVEFTVNGKVLEITETDDRVGAVHLILDGKSKPSLHPNASGMELRYYFDGEDTRVLVYNMSGKAFLDKGPLLNLSDAGSVKMIEVGSYDGQVMTAKINNLPDHYSLSQNYPNPFNPSTTIEFALPVDSKWKLVIYNILGQTVQEWEDESEAGYIEVEWDASSFASGVYFYRFKAGEFNATRKMVLIK